MSEIGREEKKRINTVFLAIQEAMDADNLIDEDEFNKIQSLKSDLAVSGIDLYEDKKQQINSILYQQLHILLLDDKLDLHEKKEIGFYREIFSLKHRDLLKIELQVRDDKVNWRKKSKI